MTFSTNGFKKIFRLVLHAGLLTTSMIEIACTRNQDIEELNISMRAMMKIARKTTIDMVEASNAKAAADIIRTRGRQTFAYLTEIRALHKKYPQLTKKYRNPTPEVQQLRAEYARLLSEEHRAYQSLLERYKRDQLVLAADEESRKLLTNFR